MEYTVLEDEFGPFLAEPGYKVHPEDKFLMRGSKKECSEYLKSLIEKMLDDSPDEFWRDYDQK